MLRSKFRLGFLYKKSQLEISSLGILYTKSQLEILSLGIIGLKEPVMKRTDLVLCFVWQVMAKNYRHM